MECLVSCQSNLDDLENLDLVILGKNRSSPGQLLDWSMYRKGSSSDHFQDNKTEHLKPDTEKYNHKIVWRKMRNTIETTDDNPPDTDLDSLD